MATFVLASTIRPKKRKSITHILYMHRKQTDAAICAWKPDFKSFSILRQRGKRKREQRQTEKSMCIPTWPCWRCLSPPEASYHSGTKRRFWPAPWGQPLTQPRWTPLCSSCGVLLHCPQPALSACTFTHSKEACFTHSRGLLCSK